MKKVQRFCATVALALALTVSTAAGEIPGPGTTILPSPPKIAVTGDILTPGAHATDDILLQGVTDLDPMTEAALSLLQSILSLF